MNLGLKIKQLRQENHLTQEDLAEQLGVSFQAVSRWENNITTPDISLLPIIANMFNVTMDYLFDLDISKKQAEIDSIIDKSLTLFNEGKIEEREKILEEALKKYPNSWDIKDSLLTVYFTKCMNLDEGNEYEQKSITLANEILEKCSVDHIRFGAMQVLVFIYRSIDKLDKAKEIVEKLPLMIISREWLYPDVVKGEERIKATQSIFVSLAEMFYEKITTTFARAEVGKRDIQLLKAVDMFKLVYENEDYGFYNSRIADIYMKCAYDQAQIQNKQKTLEYLKLSFKHMSDYTKMYNEKTILKHTSFLVDRLEDDSSKWAYSNKPYLYDSHLKKLNHGLFDFIREDEEFKKIK